jgi:hypothetical protein
LEVLLLQFLYGFLGAMFCIVLFFAGVLVGWKVKDADAERRSVKPVDPPQEAERQRLIEQQQAFHRIQNYSVEDAYGMNEDPVAKYAREER